MQTFIWGCLGEGVPTQPRERPGNIFKRQRLLVWVLKDKLPRGRGAPWEPRWWAQRRGEAGDCRWAGSTGLKGEKDCVRYSVISDTHSMLVSVVGPGCSDRLLFKRKPYGLKFHNGEGVIVSTIRSPRRPGKPKRWQHHAKPHSPLHSAHLLHPLCPSSPSLPLLIVFIPSWLFLHATHMTDGPSSWICKIFHTLVEKPREALRHRLLARLGYQCPSSSCLDQGGAGCGTVHRLRSISYSQGWEEGRAGTPAHRQLVHSKVWNKICTFLDMLLVPP